MSLSLFRGSLVLPDTIIEDGFCRRWGRICFAGPQVEAPYEDVSFAVAIPELHSAWICGHSRPWGCRSRLHGRKPRGHSRLQSCSCASRTDTLFPTTTTGQPGQISRMLEGCISARRAGRSAMELGSEAFIIMGLILRKIRSGVFSRRRRDPCPEEYKACFDLGSSRWLPVRLNCRGHGLLSRSLRPRLPRYLRAFQCYGRR